jgi:hypothetical protein
VRGERAVVDDAAAAGPLRLHQAERLLRAQERPRQVHVDDGPPLLDRQFLERHAARRGARVVEEHVEAPERPPRGLEQVRDRRRVGHVGRHGERAAVCHARLGDRILEHARPASREHDGVALAQHADGHGTPDAAAGARHQRNRRECLHGSER